jgi:hypothetical protein
VIYALPSRIAAGSAGQSIVGIRFILTNTLPASRQEPLQQLAHRCGSSENIGSFRQQFSEV